MKAKGFLIVAALLFPLGLSAGETKSTSDDFNNLDKDKDGFISKAEAKDNMDLAKNWDLVDKDHNDKVEMSEFSAFEAYVPAEDDEAPGLGAAPMK